MVTKVIETGALYFSYTVKDDSKAANSFEDIDRFYLVMVPDAVEPEKEKLVRELVVGQKCLPAIADDSAMSIERNWAFVDYITGNQADIPAKNSAGTARYRLTVHDDRSELAYVLEPPEQPDEMQRAFNIMPEASYIVKVKHPETINPYYAGAEQEPEYPEALEILFDEDWIDIVDERLLNYENAQIILIGT
ncbi:MAG TPA: hypothetical protein VGK02_06740 [Candidatus Aquicultor sp.]|jgi:hypothetical protein